MFGAYYTMSLAKPQDRDLCFFPVFQVEIRARVCYNGQNMERVRRAIVREAFNMKIELTEQQFRYLLDLVYIGNWIMNSTREETDRIREYDAVESTIFSHCLHHRMSKLVELYNGELIPSRAFADGGIHEVIEQYEDVTFFEILAEELALRDMDGEPMTGENYEALKARIDAYLSEFDRYGTDHITVDMDES